VELRRIIDTAGSRTRHEIRPLTTTTTTTTSSQQQQQQQTTFDDDGHYGVLYDDISGGIARIPTWRRSFIDETGHYDYPEFSRPVTSNDETVEQRQRPPGHYEQLDPSVLETLRQPPAPSVYAGLSPNTTDASQDISVQPDAGNPENYERLDRGSLNEPSVPREYAGISGIGPSSQTTVSHDYLEVIPSSEDDTDAV